MQPIVFVDDAHTFGGAQIALGWAIRAILHQCHTQPVVCVCTPATREAVKQITGEDKNLRFIDCPPALPLNIFTFPLRLWVFYKLLKPMAGQGVRSWRFNLAGIEFCLAPLLILRLFGMHPIAWLHNNETFTFFNTNRSMPIKIVSWARDAMANRLIFGLYRLIVTTSHATEIALKTRFHCINPPLTGFLYPTVGLRIGPHKIEREVTNPAHIDLWMINRMDYKHKNNLAGLEVLKHLHDLGKPACLTVVGDGPDMAHFRSSTQELGLSGFVRFKGWQENPWESVPDNAIVLIPSFFESFCLVAREAMLYGARMVLSPLPVFFEWIPSKLIARDFSAEAFVEEIEEVFSMSRERVLALYTEALRKFTEEAFVVKFESFLQAATAEEHQLPGSARAGRN